MSGADLEDIRLALWQLLAEVKAGDVDAEAGDTACSILDSLLETVRLETHEPAPTEGRRASEEALDQAKGVPP